MEIRHVRGCFYGHISSLTAYIYKLSISLYLFDYWNLFKLLYLIALDVPVKIWSIKGNVAKNVHLQLSICEKDAFSGYRRAQHTLLILIIPSSCILGSQEYFKP